MRIRRDRVVDAFNPLKTLILLTVLTGCASAPERHVAPDYDFEVLVPGSPMHGVHGLAFDQNNELFGASLIGNSIYRIGTRTGHVSTFIAPPLGNADDVAFAPDGTIAWTAGAFSAVHALTPDGDIKILADGLPGVNSINYSPNGRLFVTQVFGGDALWEIDSKGVAEPRRIAKKLGGLNGFEVTEDLQLYGPLFLKGKIVRVDIASGEVTEIADGFKVPAAVNLDSQGRLYVVDFQDGSVTRLDLKSGARDIIAELEPPLDNLAINSRDEIYVSNPATNTITAIDPDTGATRVITSGHFSAPGGIDIAQIDGRTVVFVADFWGNRYIDAETGERTMLKLPQGVTASASLATHDDVLALASIWPFGLLYIIDRDAQKIIKTAKFKAPYNPVFFSDGSVVVADYTAGTLTRLAPGKSRDKDVFAVGLEGPVGLATDGDEILYVGEYDSGRIWQLDLVSGERKMIAEGLDRPEGLAVIQDGRVLVAETGAGRLLRIKPDTGEFDVVADNLAIGLPGGADMPAPFIPTGVAVDADDNIYISADRTNALYKLSRK
jgi:sugar lactone lactonase YvrE